MHGHVACLQFQGELSRTGCISVDCTSTTFTSLHRERWRAKSRICFEQQSFMHVPANYKRKSLGFSYSPLGLGSWEISIMHSIMLDICSCKIDATMEFQNLESFTLLPGIYLSSAVALDSRCILIGCKPCSQRLRYLYDASCAIMRSELTMTGGVSGPDHAGVFRDFVSSSTTLYDACASECCPTA